MKYDAEYFDKSLIKLSGYAETKYVDCFSLKPSTIEECKKIIEIANNKNMTICCKGNGLSYADQITNKKNIVLNLNKINKIINWDSDNGVLKAQTGVTFGQIFIKTMIDGWALPSCPGSMDITIGGAISNNVHGKDSYKMGNFGNNIISFKLLTSSGKTITVTKNDDTDLFNAVISGMGLIGIIVEAKIKLKKIKYPFIKSKNIISKNISNTIEIFENNKENSDFSVAWSDCFPDKDRTGRGFVSLAKWSEDKIDINEEKLLNSLIKNNTKSDYIFDILPANFTWSILKYFANRSSFKYLNKIFYNYNHFKNLLSLNKNRTELFNEYNFIHNKLPDIKKIHKPKGFLEFQPLLPHKNIEKNFKEILSLCQKFKCESLLCGVKLHKKDNFLLSYQLDGYSMGIDIQVKGKKAENIIAFSNDLFALVCDVGGKIYLAKDEYLTKNYFKKMYPDYVKFLKIKNKYDEKNIFSSDLFNRLF